MAWDRNTPWRQGHVLPTDALQALGLTHPQADANNTVAIVISHDCDLANDDMDAEPHAEIIVGQLVATLRGDCTHAKVPRRLHLSFSTSEGLKHIELLATGKKLYPKELLGQFAPQPWVLSEEDATILQRWLGARYRRAAFPDDFEAILKGAKLHEKIARILEPCPDITAIFFDVQEAGGLYSLGIILLYDTGEDPDAAEAIATRAATAISDAFVKKLRDQSKGWQGIELTYCEPMSDEALTYRQSTLLKQWRLEYLSLRAEPQQSMTAE